MTKRYAVINRKTLKVPSIRFATRDEARAYKRSKGFRYAIYDQLNESLVR